MGFGKLRRIWERIKSFGKTVWHKVIKPVVQTFAPAIKTGLKTAANYLAPGSGVAASGIIDGVVDTVAGQPGAAQGLAADINSRAITKISDIKWR